MQIKARRSRDLLRESLTALGERRALAVRLGLLAAALAAAAAAGARAQRAGLFEEAPARLAGLLRAPFVRAVCALRSAPQRLDLDIKHKDLQELARQREDALARGVLLSSPEDYVPGWVRQEGRAVRMRIRLKGDWTDHLRGEAWSFRLKLLGGETLMGMREFSVQKPGTRGHLNEWVFHEALRREDVLTPRYDFIALSLNGKDLGIYALEEHFDKRLLEGQRRREGPILKFDETVMWADRRQSTPEHFRNSLGVQTPERAVLDAFGEGRLQASPALAAMRRTGAGLLEGLRSGTFPASKVLDLERWARFYAICDLLGAQHGAIWHNLRFYYNPVTGLLEPVAYNGNAGAPRNSVRTPQEGPPFTDPEFYRAYVRALERVSQPAYLDALLADLAPELERRQRLLRSDEPDYRFDPSIYQRNRWVIHNALHPPRAVHAYLREVREGRLVLEAAVIVPMPIEVDGLAVATAPLVAPERPVVLAEAAPGAPMAYRPLSFRLPRELRWEPGLAAHLRLLVRIPGESLPFPQDVYPVPRPDPRDAAAALARREPNARSFPFLAFQEAEKVILVRPGSWRIERDLVVPRGWRLRAGEGTRLDLRKGASILSLSPLELLGSEEAPVVIGSEDATGKGVAVLQAGGRSRLRHARVRGLAAPAGLTGALTFYESDVEMSHCVLEGARSEDGLNVVRSQVEIADSLFRRTAGDAVDFDFAKGSLLRTSFQACGNDCLDVSGTVLTVRGAVFAGAKDKGISVGEMSRLEAADVRVSDARIGVASKDISMATVDGLRLERVRWGLAAYQKKPEFGPAMLDARDVSMTGGERAYLLEPGSRLGINGARLEPNSEHLRTLIYGEAKE